MEHSAILLTCIKLPFVIKIFVLSIFEWQLKTGFTVFANIIDYCNSRGKQCGSRSDTGSTLFDEEASKTFPWTTKADDICCD